MKSRTITRHTKPVPGGNMSKRWVECHNCARFGGDKSPAASERLQSGSAGPAVDPVPISISGPVLHDIEHIG